MLGILAHTPLLHVDAQSDGISMGYVDFISTHSLAAKYLPRNHANIPASCLSMRDLLTLASRCFEDESYRHFSPFVLLMMCCEIEVSWHASFLPSFQQRQAFILQAGIDDILHHGPGSFVHFLFTLFLWTTLAKPFVSEWLYAGLIMPRLQERTIQSSLKLKSQLCAVIGSLQSDGRFSQSVGYPRLKNCGHQS